MTDDPWWRTAAIYQIYPRSFADSDGDGIGDLPGITAKVEYLRWLGVDAVWLCPFYPSPMVDFGYDVSDYTGVDPTFGTLADFDALVSALHAHGIRIVVDFVPNHSSDQHPWFVESKSSRSAGRRGWYVWADPQPDGSPPNNWQSYFGGSAWELDPGTGQYYLHTYHRTQPDLNWANSEVRQAMADVLRFWLARGVDGFRVDVLWILGKDPALRDNPPNKRWRAGQPYWHRQIRLHSEDGPDAHTYARFIRAVIDECPDRVMLGEVVLPADRAMAYYGTALDEAHLPLNFGLAELTAWSPESLSVAFDDYLAALPPGAAPNWFLGNHDFERIASRLGQRMARLAHVLVATLPGAVLLYYGDELGLPNGHIPAHLTSDPQAVAFPERSREAARTPMQWDTTTNAGFSTATPWLPLARADPEWTIANQRKDPASTLQLIRALLRLRAHNPAVKQGEYARLPLANPHLLAYTRTTGDHQVTVIANLATKKVPTPACPDGQWTPLLSSVANTNPNTLQPMEAKVLGRIAPAPKQ
jgi:alpha-glucosidase